MELKKGMYIRTDKGKIAKIINQKDTSGGLHTKNLVWVLDDFSVLALYSKKVTKASFNIIDLIEVGDVLVVDGIKYTVLQNENHCNNALYIKTINNHYSTIGYLFEQNIIESIVTKEQFERESYKVSE